MPNSDDSILFSSEFNPADFNKGVDGMIDGMKKLQAEEKRLQDSIAESEKRLSEQTEQVKKMSDQLKAAGNDTKNYSAENKRLADGMATVIKQNEALTNTIEKQKQQLSAAGASIKDMQSKYLAAADAIRKANEATGKTSPIDANAIVNKVRLVKDEVISSGKAVVTGVASQISQGKNATDSILSSIQGFGAAWGIAGIAASGALSLVIGKLLELSDEEKKYQKIKEDLDFVNNKGAENASQEISNLRILYEATQNTTLSMKERKRAVDELQKDYPAYFGNLSQEAILAGKAAAQYEKLYQAILKRGFADAAKDRIKSITGEILNDLITVADAEKQIEEARKRGVLTGSGVRRLPDGKIVPESFSFKTDQRSVDNEITRIKDQYSKAFTVVKDGQDRIKAITDAVGAENLLDAVIGDPLGGKGAKKTKEVVNIYQQELLKIKAEIEKINQQTFTDEATITAAVNADFEKRGEALIKAFKNKQLTSSQLQSLQENLSNLQQLILAKQISDFQQQRKLYLEKINGELEALQFEEAARRTQLLQDTFERDRQTIIAETNRTAKTLAQTRDKLISDLLKDAAKNGLTKDQVRPQVEAIKDVYSKLLDDLNVARDQKLQKLSFDTFESLSRDAKRLLDSGNLGISQGSLVNIQKLGEELAQGKISYNAYQKELTAITKFELEERNKLQKLYLEKEIARRQNEIATNRNLTPQQKQQLTDEITGFQQQLTDIEINEEKRGAKEIKESRDKRFSELQAYIQAFASVVASIGQAWQASNDAEAKAVERSIRLQQRRVDAATKLAERGNASYLKLEQDRLNELQLKQEAAARRSLAINAAVQASQLLVGITGAIAQIGKGGPVNVVAGLVTIFGALAAGYGLVKSLQSNQPSFFVGTEDTGPGGKEDSKGGFTATLHPHERVVDANNNKKLKGISNRELAKKVELAATIERMYGSHRLPRLNYDKLEQAAHDKVTHDSRLAGILEENNHKMDEVNGNIITLNKTMKKIGVNFNIDRRGLVAMLLTGIDQNNIHKKA